METDLKRSGHIVEQKLRNPKHKLVLHHFLTVLTIKGRRAGEFSSVLHKTLIYGLTIRIYAGPGFNLMI